MTVISRDAYVWGHFAVILFHIGIAAVLISMYYVEDWSENTLRTIALSLGWVLMAVSLLALVPIFKYYPQVKEVEIKK